VYYDDDDDEKSVNTYYPMMTRKENNINDARRQRRQRMFSSSSASTSSSSPNTTTKVDDVLKQFLSLTAEEKRDVFQSLFGKGGEERKILAEKEKKLFAAFDSDGDKMLTPQEFQNFHRAFLWRHLQQEPEVGNEDGEQRSRSSSGSSKEITYAQLKSVALSQMYPFIGFGFLDNALMLAFGETIESSVGLSLGLSTMAAAAIGNTLSDVCGVGLANKIEYWCAKFGLTEEVTMTTGQAKEMRVVVARLGGAMTGVTIGCIVGSFPLLLH
jgi:tRNA-specific adenosine deaminase 1